ncbi:hypothetical protein KCU95_g14526, partial [Aureobasidium melanogenum]
MANRPRYAASLDALTLSRWNLNHQSLLVYFDESIFKSESFINALRKLADDFAEDRRRHPTSTIQRVSRVHEWVPWDIAQVRETLSNEVTAPRVNAYDQINTQDQVNTHDRVNAYDQVDAHDQSNTQSNAHDHDNTHDQENAYDPVNTDDQLP